MQPPQGRRVAAQPVVVVVAQQPSIKLLDELPARQMPVAPDPVRDAADGALQTLARGPTHELYPPPKGTVPVQLEAENDKPRAST
ncbi:MAG: hypothetical protein N838_35820 [Thiohalocapsa sp. PB-PSB1]|nr:MAG: hypothetical protein N838_35820 [Thiohalocapsa sp. PB-PSB1]